MYDDNVKVPFDKDKDGNIEAGEAVGSKVQFKEILGAASHINSDNQNTNH